MTTAAARGLDAAAIRRDFRILDQSVRGHPLVYLDNAATTQKPEPVLDAIRTYYHRDNANVHRGVHELSRRATDAYESARVRAARWINAPEAAELIWTRGTTEAINLVASSWGGTNLKEGDEVLLSKMEHHSNLIPWQLVARHTGARLRFFDVTDDGTLDLSELDELINPRTRVVAIGHVSNSLGTIHPVAEVARAARAVGAIVVVDGAQGAPHLTVDVQRLGVDFYAFSGHKMCGPTGIGALWGRRELLEAMVPYQGGGEMIRIVELERSTWAEVPHKFEAGTPDIAGAIGLAAAMDYLDGIGRDAIRRHEVELTTYAMERLAPVPGIRLFGPADPELRSGVVSFHVDWAHPHDVSTVLDEYGVAVRAGHHCTQPLMRHLGVAATTRASFYVYNTRDDIDRLADGMRQAARVFKAEA